MSNNQEYAEELYELMDQRGLDEELTLLSKITTWEEVFLGLYATAVSSGDIRRRRLFEDWSSVRNIMRAAIEIYGSGSIADDPIPLGEDTHPMFWRATRALLEWKLCTLNRKNLLWLYQAVEDTDKIWVVREYARMMLVYEHNDALVELWHKALQDKKPDQLPFLLSFPHLSANKDNEFSLVFTESANKGIRDLQTPIAIGKYLTKMKLFEDQKSIKEFVTSFNAKCSNLTVKFARTREEIHEVYMMETTNWSSCMQGEKEFSLSRLGGVHPTEVYATPDCAVAYLLTFDGGRLAARAVINEKDKYYVRIYGNERLIPLLESMGYTEGDLAGCTLLRLTTESGALIAPYIDGGSSTLLDTGEELIVRDDGQYYADSTYGTLNEPTVECVYCHELVDPDEASLDVNEEYVCNYCIENREAVQYALIARNNYQYVDSDDCVWYGNLEEWVAEWYIEEIAVWSDHLDKWIDSSTSVDCKDLDSNMPESDCHYCEVDGEYYYDVDEMPTDDDDEEAA